MYRTWKLLVSAVLIAVAVSANLGASGAASDVQQQPVELTLVCVRELDDGNFEAHFSYNNPNAFDVTVPIAVGTRGGQGNWFSPGSIDQGQPETFSSVNPEEFSVVFAGSQVFWHLRGPDGSLQTLSATQFDAGPLKAPCDKETTESKVITISKTVVGGDNPEFGFRIRCSYSNGFSALAYDDTLNYPGDFIGGVATVEPGVHGDLDCRVGENLTQAQRLVWGVSLNGTCVGEGENASVILYDLQDGDTVNVDIVNKEYVAYTTQFGDCLPPGPEDLT